MTLFYERHYFFFFFASDTAGVRALPIKTKQGTPL